MNATNTDTAVCENDIANALKLQNLEGVTDHNKVYMMAGNLDELEAPYNCTLSADLIKKAEEELNEKDKWRDRDIQALRDMVLAHKGLKCPLDSAFLLRFLRAKKFDYDRAYNLIINYYTMRAQNADVIKELTPLAVKHVFDSGVVCMLPLRDRLGRTILYFRPGKWNPADFSLMEILRANIISLELAVRDEITQVNGVVAIGNMADMGLVHAKNFDRNYARLMTGLVQDAFPLRFKGIHFVNEPAVFGAIFMIIKPFLKEKMVKRLNFHGSSLEGLYNTFERDILPQELGGNLPSDDELAEAWKGKVLAHQDLYEEMMKYKIELPTEICKGKVVETSECLAGTYKRLAD